MTVRKYKRKKGKSISKAKKYNYKGISYKSGLEKYMAQALYDAKIKFRYEPTKFVLQEGFNFKLKSYERQTNSKGEFKNRGEKKILPITYTPDFIGKGFIIETKGYANESFPIKWKIFKNIMNDVKDLTIYKPQNRKECDETVKIILNKYERK